MGEVELFGGIFAFETRTRVCAAGAGEVGEGKRLTNHRKFWGFQVQAFYHVSR